MTETPREHISLWVATAPGSSYASLQGDVDVDVAVLGAGIAGLTTAILLRRAGKRVAVVESNRLVQSVTGYTTAEVTSGHSLIYAELIDAWGEVTARIYGESNQVALERIAQFVTVDGLDCDFERKTNCCYEVAPGQGAIVEVDRDKVALYKDEQGTVHALSAVCTHMRCLVGWNPSEKSWDCPCHGSRFDVTGKVIHGPGSRGSSAEGAREVAVVAGE